PSSIRPSPRTTSSSPIPSTESRCSTIKGRSESWPRTTSEARGRFAWCKASTSSGCESRLPVKPFLGALILSAAGGAGVTWAQVPQYALPVPAAFPRPQIPADNPITAPKVELGRRLFYDTRLSGNGQQSCSTCHEQARAFTDGKGRAVGSTGQTHP